MPGCHPLETAPGPGIHGWGDDGPELEVLVVVREGERVLADDLQVVVDELLAVEVLRLRRGGGAPVGSIRSRQF